MTVDSIASATPDTRDRFVDFLRVASLLGVILGHFLMAVVFLHPHADPAQIEFTNVLELAPWTRWGTLLLQVMPIFFVVGGFAHATSIRSLRARGGGYADFVYARISRLVRPALVFVGVGVAIGLVVDAAVADRLEIGPVLQIAGQLLWFIGIYLIAAAFAPALLRAHERFGWRALAALVAAAALVDVLRLAADVGGVKWLNFAFVWLALHQLGFFYADGVAGSVSEPGRGRRLGAAMVAVGAATIAALAAFGPYGVAMVSYEGETLSNLAPPTVSLLAFGVAQAGALLLIRPFVTRWLARRGPWRAVIAGGAVAMTAFLWHFTALIAVFVALWIAGVTLDDSPTTATFWWIKLAVLVPFLAVVAALVAVFRRFDRPPPRSEVVGPSAARSALAVVGVACAIVGMIGFAATGFRGLATGYVAHVVGVPMTSWAAAALVAASAVVTRLAVSTRR
ncbi:acyltransferase [Demequina sp.]|uniref:acyltransferase family protein n=1 Tax=Demequina sp. TaxID=2050685 RepID=UPI0025BABA8D|nr:acyltransferase [Demequina sp.]